MKKILGFFIIILVAMSAFSQGNEIPSVELKTLDGQTFNTKEISNDGKPIIINFWATWCKPCVLELMTISEEYEDWVEETGVIFYAVSIDDSRTTSRVKPFINAKGWEYEILLDANQDFKRAMNVSNPPFTFVIDGKGEIVWKHIGYKAGDEEELYEVLKKVAAGEDLNGH